MGQGATGGVCGLSSVVIFCIYLRTEKSWTAGNGQKRTGSRGESGWSEEVQDFQDFRGDVPFGFHGHVAPMVELKFPHVRVS